MIDFAKFLACCELVTIGLAQFDDKPETYRTQQSSFINAISGLGISASEELRINITDQENLHSPHHWSLSSTANGLE